MTNLSQNVKDSYTRNTEILKISKFKNFFDMKKRVNSSTFDRERSPVLLNNLQTVMICFHFNFASGTSCFH